MLNQANYQVYKLGIQTVLLDPQQLPALPAVTLQIRSLLADQNSDSAMISACCAKDPGFSALLMAAVASPLYAQQNKASTLSSAVAVLGRSRVQNLAMAYSLKSLFLIRRVELKKLYEQIWQRMMMKAAISSYLAKRTQLCDAEQALLTALLTEVGTLATLSAFAEIDGNLDNKVFFRLCREYAKSLGALLLRRWNIADDYELYLKSCGRWSLSVGEDLQLIDLINLALHSSVTRLNSKNNLPKITSLPSYLKLEPQFRVLDEHGRLLLVSANTAEIEQLQKLMS
ncbi:HDOD domain-containing protein [Agaribacterium sp. ZY112]|uniref:HDOD domain-containing protein n=1 Tax=Agaribacterium sp. ZY112 TaxID=3233574 RepID=UPI0035255EEB